MRRGSLIGEGTTMTLFSRPSGGTARATLALKEAGKI